MPSPRSLQWSHGPKAVETRPQVVASQAHRLASMEPRPEGRGDVVDVRAELALRLASMEPRPEGRGDIRGANVGDAVCIASMEPRPEGRGDILALADVGVVAPDASMEPRPEGRGDRTRSRSTARKGVFERPLFTTPKAESHERTMLPMRGPCLTENWDSPSLRAPTGGSVTTRPLVWPSYLNPFAKVCRPSSTLLLRAHPDARLPRDVQSDNVGYTILT